MTTKWRLNSSNSRRCVGAWCLSWNRTTVAQLFLFFFCIQHWLSVSYEWTFNCFGSNYVGCSMRVSSKFYQRVSIFFVMNLGEGGSKYHYRRAMHVLDDFSRGHFQMQRMVNLRIITRTVFQSCLSHLFAVLAIWNVRHEYSQTFIADNLWDV